MALAQPITLINEITDFLAKSPSAEEILAFQLSEALSNRALELLEANRRNTLGPDEREEMNEYMRMEHFMTLLKAKTRLNLMKRMSLGVNY
jgi:hypothetical protein